MAGTRFGGYAERVVVAAGDVVPLAERLSFEQGAAIPVNYTTAWAGLIALRQPPARRARAHPRGRGRRRDRGDADRQAPRRGGLRHRLAVKHEAIRGFGVDHPLDYTRIGLGARPAQVRPHHGRDRRQELPPQLQPAAARRPPGGLRRLVGRGRREAQPAHGRAGGRAHAALQPDQADVGLEGGHRPEHAHAVGRPRHARAVDRAAARADRRRHGLPGGRRGLPVRARARRPPDDHASGATSARSCSSR